MDQAQVILSLLTIAASGVVSGIVTFKLNASRESRRLRREKLEQLFLAHRAFLRQLDVGWLPYMHVMAEKIDYNSALELTAEGAKGSVNQFEVAEMLVSIYFPEADEEFSRLVGIRDHAAALIHAHRREYEQRGPHRSEALTRMEELSAALTDHEKRFQALLRTLARRVGAHEASAA